MRSKLVSIRFAGIDFFLEVDVNRNGEYEGILSVWVKTKKGILYQEIEFEVEEFESLLKDEILDALEQDKIENKLAHDDMVYELAREKTLS
jgi:hypothetical protein